MTGCSGQISQARHVRSLRGTRIASRQFSLRVMADNGILDGRCEFASQMLSEYSHASESKKG